LTIYFYARGQSCSLTGADRGAVASEGRVVLHPNPSGGDDGANDNYAGYTKQAAGNPSQKRPPAFTDCNRARLRQEESAGGRQTARRQCDDEGWNPQPDMNNAAESAGDQPCEQRGWKC
jgi:hypothetical protein